jgi:hypothetical protein
MSTKKKQKFQSKKQLEEFEGKEKHIWHQRKKELEQMRFKELEDVVEEPDENTGD